MKRCRIVVDFAVGHCELGSGSVDSAARAAVGMVVVDFSGCDVE